MLRHSLLISVFTIGISTASTISLGNFPQADETSVSITAGQLGAMVSGAAGETAVFFSSFETLTTAGQRTEPASGFLTQLNISLAPGWTFQDVIFNASCTGGRHGCSTEDNELSVGVSDGTTKTFNLGTGNNFVTVLGSNLTAVTLTSNKGFSDLREVRLSGLNNETAPPQVPEPGTMGILASGLGGVLVACRRLRTF